MYARIMVRQSYVLRFQPGQPRCALRRQGQSSRGRNRGAHGAQQGASGGNQGRLGRYVRGVRVYLAPLLEMTRVREARIHYAHNVHTYYMLTLTDPGITLMRRTGAGQELANRLRARRTDRRSRVQGTRPAAYHQPPTTHIYLLNRSRHCESTSSRCAQAPRSSQLPSLTRWMPSGHNGAPNGCGGERSFTSAPLSVSHTIFLHKANHPIA